MYAFKDFVFWSKNKLFRRKAIDEYKCSIASLKLSKDELLRLNFKKRKAIVEYAYANSAFYHDFYERRGFVRHNCVCLLTGRKFLSWKRKCYVRIPKRYLQSVLIC